MWVPVGFESGDSHCDGSSCDRRGREARGASEGRPALYKQKKWKEAATALRKLKGKVEKEERPKIERMLSHTQGEMKWKKLRASIKKSSKPRAVITKVDKFIRKHRKSRALRKKAESYKKRWLKKIYTTIEDFEKNRELDQDLKIVKDPTLVKQGKYAARWVSRHRGDYSVLIDCAIDWTEYHTLVLWIHASKKGGRLTLDALADEDDYFEAWNNIDWVGWKEVRIRFKGKKLDSDRRGSPIGPRSRSCGFGKIEAQNSTS